MSASLRILSSKADSNTWESFTRSELKLESVHQESPRSDIFRKRATKPLLKQKHHQKKNWTVAQCSKVLFSDESKCCISFVNQGPRVWRKRGETQNPCFLKSSVTFPQSVMVWAAMSSAGVGPLCFLKSTVNAAIYQHFMLPSADKLYGDADFIFQQDLASAHTAKGTKRHQLWWTFLQSACQLHAPSKLATSVALCCVIKLHILEWPFIVASLKGVAHRM